MSGTCILGISGCELTMITWSSVITANREQKALPSTQTKGQFDPKYSLFLIKSGAIKNETCQSVSYMCFHRQVFIDFDTLQTNNPVLGVQRRSLLPQGLTEEVGWYYRDDYLWCEYGAQVRFEAFNSLDFQGFSHSHVSLFLLRTPARQHPPSAAETLSGTLL